MDYFLVAALVVSLAINLYLVAKPKKYNGEIVVITDSTGKKTFLLEIESNPEDLEELGEILFKVTDRMEPDDDDAA